MTAPAGPSCSRCGCCHVKWAQRRDGSYYLAIQTPEATADLNGRYMAKVGRKPHAGRCGTYTDRQGYQVPLCGRCYAAWQATHQAEADRRRAEAVAADLEEDLATITDPSTHDRMAQVLARFRAAHGLTTTTEV